MLVPRVCLGSNLSCIFSDVIGLGTCRLWSTLGDTRTYPCAKWHLALKVGGGVSPGVNQGRSRFPAQRIGESLSQRNLLPALNRTFVLSSGLHWMVNVSLADA